MKKHCVACVFLISCFLFFSSAASAQTIRMVTSIGAPVSTFQSLNVGGALRMVQSTSSPKAIIGKSSLSSLSFFATNGSTFSSKLSVGTNMTAKNLTTQGTVKLMGTSRLTLDSGATASFDETKSKKLQFTTPNTLALTFNEGYVKNLTLLVNNANNNTYRVPFPTPTKKMIWSTQTYTFTAAPIVENKGASTNIPMPGAGGKYKFLLLSNSSGIYDVSDYEEAIGGGPIYEM